MGTDRGSLCLKMSPNPKMSSWRWSFLRKLPKNLLHSYGLQCEILLGGNWLLLMSPPWNFDVFMLALSCTLCKSSSFPCHALCLSSYTTALLLAHPLSSLFPPSFLLPPSFLTPFLPRPYLFTLTASLSLFLSFLLLVRLPLQLLSSPIDPLLCSALLYSSDQREPDEHSRKVKPKLATSPNGHN